MSRPSTDQDNILLELPLNEESGTAYDISGNGNNGTATGTSSVKTTYNGRYSRSFNGTSDYIDCGDLTEMEGLTTFSFSIWVYFDDFTNDTEQRIVHKWYNTQQSFLFTQINQDNDIRFAIAQSFGVYKLIDVLDNSNFVENKWLHFSGTFHGSTEMVLYLNGEIIGSSTSSIPTSIAATSTNLVFGRRFTSSQIFKGKIGETKMWDKVLTQEEVQQDYKNTYRE